MSTKQKKKTASTTTVTTSANQDSSVDPSIPSLSYTSSLPDWHLVRDIFGGARSIREKRETYLPRFIGEADADYNLRVETAPFVNHFADNLRSISAKPFSKEVVLQGDVTSEMKEIAENVDGYGNGLHKFSRDLYEEATAQGRAGVLVDFPVVTLGETLADVRKRGVRPYWVMYRAEDILALYTAFRDGRRYVTHVRLREDAIVRNGYQERLVKRVREINDDGNARTWQLWQKDGDTGQWSVIENGSLTLPEIPFRELRFDRPGTRSAQTGGRIVPPLVDMAHLQIEHYQQSSNLKHVLTLAGFPMIAGNGVVPQMGTDGKPIPVPIGPGVVLYAPPMPGMTTRSEWAIIEPQGTSIERLQAQIEAIEYQMNKLGMAPLTRNTGGVTATAEAVASAKAHAAAEAWASDEKDTLEELFEFTAMWIQQKTAAEVFIHTDFGVELRDSQEISNIIQSYKDGVISLETAWDELQRRGFLGPQFDHERELVKLKKEKDEADKRAFKIAQLAAKNSKVQNEDKSKQNAPQQDAQDHATDPAMEAA